MHSKLLFSGLCGLALATSVVASTAEESPNPASLAGIYQAIPDGQRLPGGLHNSGDPANIEVLAHPALPEAGSTAPLDPYRLCQAVGPFRMMALPELRFELVPANGRVVVLFEDLSHGYLRDFYLNRAHPPQPTVRYAFQGDSVGKWSGATLTVDTNGFNQRTWLNSHVQASDALHLTEQIRPVLQGRYLELQMTASDPKVLSKPYSYVRYYERVNTPIAQNVCQIDSDWQPGVDP